MHHELLTFPFLNLSKRKMTTLNLNNILLTASNPGKYRAMLRWTCAAEMSVHMSSVRIQKNQREVCPT